MPNNMISLPLQTEKFGKRNSSEFLKDEHWVCYGTEIKTWGPFVSLQPPCCSIHVCTYPDLQSHTEKLNKMRESMNKRTCMSAHGQITQFSTYRRVQVKLKHFHPHLQLKVKILLSCPCSLFLPQIRIKERRDSWSSLRCGGFLLGAGALIPSSEQLRGVVPASRSCCSHLGEASWSYGWGSGSAESSRIQTSVQGCPGVISKGFLLIPCC